MTKTYEEYASWLASRPKVVFAQQSKREHWFEQSDLDYLHEHYMSLVSDGFRKENNNAARKRWNKTAALWSVLIGIGVIVLMVAR